MENFSTSFQSDMDGILSRLGPFPKSLTWPDRRDFLILACSYGARQVGQGTCPGVAPTFTSFGVGATLNPPDFWSHHKEKGYSRAFYDEFVAGLASRRASFDLGGGVRRDGTFLIKAAKARMLIHDSSSPADMREEGRLVDIMPGFHYSVYVTPSHNKIDAAVVSFPPATRKCNMPDEGVTGMSIFSQYTEQVSFS